MSLPEPIVERIKIQDLVKKKILIPECQREKEWDDDMYDVAIDSILNNIDIGQIIMSFSSELDLYEIIDGQHRYEAITKYIRNENKYDCNKKITVCIYKNLTIQQQKKLYIRINSGLEQNMEHMEKVNDTKNIKEYINSFSDRIDKDDNDDKLNLLVNTVLYIVQDYYYNGEANITVKNLTKKNHFLKNLNKMNDNYDNIDTKNIIKITDYILKEILRDKVNLLDCINKVKKVKPIILTSIIYHIMHEFFNKIKGCTFKFDFNYDTFYTYIWTHLYKEKNTKIKDNFAIICTNYVDYINGTLVISNNDCNQDDSSDDD
jgi:hypothetical protein